MASLLETIFRLTHPRSTRMLASLPGPPPVPIFGNALQIAGHDLHTHLEGWRHRYGELVRFWVLGQPTLLTARPEHVAEVLVDRADDWIKGVPRLATKPVGGGSVFRSPGGADWGPRRAAHPFEARWIDAFYDAILDPIRRRTRERLAPLVAAAEGSHVDLYREILRASFDAFALGVFGELLPDEAFEEHETLLTEVGKRGAMGPFAISWSPTFWSRRGRWMGRLEARMARGSLSGDAHDLISTLARHGADLRTTRARDELSNVFAAGMKNVAIAAAATHYFLLRDDGVRARVEGELDALGEDCPRAALLAAPIFDRAVKESLRLIPPVAGFLREVAPDREVSLAGVVLPRRTQIFLVPWIVHRETTLWPDPLRFDPDRFLAEPARGAYFPFGLGDRYCVGRDWTILVTKAIVATLLARTTCALDPGASFETTLVAALTVPKNGLPATIRSRTR